MGKNVSLDNFDERLAHADDVFAKNGLRIKHVRDIYESGGVAVVYRRQKKNSFIELSTAICSKRDQYNKKIGRILATESFERGEVIRVPIRRGFKSADIISMMFS